MMPLNQQISIGWLLIVSILIIFFINMIKIVIYAAQSCQTYFKEKEQQSNKFGARINNLRVDPIVPINLGDNTLQEFFPEGHRNADISYLND
jgi:hypothetical protein